MSRGRRHYPAVTALSADRSRLLCPVSGATGLFQLSLNFRMVLKPPLRAFAGVFWRRLGGGGLRRFSRLETVLRGLANCFFLLPKRVCLQVRQRQVTEPLREAPFSRWR